MGLLVESFADLLANHNVGLYRFIGEVLNNSWLIVERPATSSSMPPTLFAPTTEKPNPVVYA